jgi:hypothetical protein
VRETDLVTLPRSARPDLADLVVGVFYVDTLSDQTFEFIGTAEISPLMGDDHEELVGVFRLRDGTHCILATHRDYDNGQRFVLP